MNQLKDDREREDCYRDIKPMPVSATADGALARPQAEVARQAPVVIRCNLIPMSQAIAFVVVLVTLSTLSWLCVPLKGFLGPLSALLQVLLIPVIIATAMKLKLKLSGNGLMATSTLHKDSLYQRNYRHWNDLHSVRLRRLKSPASILERIRNSKERRLSRSGGLLELLGKGWTQQGFLILDFTSGGLVAFPLAGFSPQSLEDLFLSLSRWADPMSLNADVIALQRDILTGQHLQLNDSYTRMWEESLRSRFEVTNFVPLSGGHELQNGRLKILMLLACGGMSSVYLAKDGEGKRLVVKEMAVPHDGDDAALAKVHEMFSREAKLLSKLDHPHIVKVIDHFVEHGRDYLILEFVPGLTLRQQVQMHGRFSEAQVRDMARQIAEILLYMHQCEPAVIHRDLTPDNLVVREPDKTICLIDFGAANEFIGKVTGTLIGKQCYIPPEQFQGQAVPQSDLYALGATLSYLLTGSDPEPISVSHPQQIEPSVSPEFDSLIASLTAIEAETRIQSAEQLLRALQELPAVNSNG